MLLLECCLVVVTLTWVCAVSENEFPDDFLFGVGSSAYQNEGAWNISDKGESIWDRYVHTKPHKIDDGSTGDVASDSYHKFKEDVQLIKSIKANTYRFSLSWPRILPDGFSNRVSKDGVRYYNDLIDECINNGIIPMVTLYHWDLPQKLQDLGGWLNPDITVWFADYAEVAFKLFGDRVKIWITINEPFAVCLFGYGNGMFAPGMNKIDESILPCFLHVLLAHVKVYAMYGEKYRSTQNGKVGVAVIPFLIEPMDNTSAAHFLTPERALDMSLGWFLQPLFTSKGGFPEIIEQIIAMMRHRADGSSSLPEHSQHLTNEQFKNMRNSSDFIGINYYTTFTIRRKKDGNMRKMDNPKYISITVLNWEIFSLRQNKPRGLADLLKMITSKYQLPEIYITENGYPDRGGLQDVERTAYFHDHLHVLLNSIRSGINIKGYMAWCLIDNFQWTYGYTKRYGIFDVDFNKTDKPRSPKLSAKFISEFYSTRKIPDLSKFLHSGKSTTSSINPILISLSFCSYFLLL